MLAGQAARISAPPAPDWVRMKYELIIHALTALLTCIIVWKANFHPVFTPEHCTHQMCVHLHTANNQHVIGQNVSIQQYPGSAVFTDC